MITLNEVIRQMYATAKGYRSYFYNYRDAYSYNTSQVFLEIPIDSPTYEVPLFAMYAYEKCLIKARELQVPLGEVANKIVAHIYQDNKQATYATIDRNMLDILRGDFDTDKIVLFKVKQSGNQTVDYYGTRGLILDKDLKVVLICSWAIENVSEGRDMKIRYLRPIMRINPRCFVGQNNPLERYISKKLPVESLKAVIHPCKQGNFFDFAVNGPHTELNVKVEIDTSPFNIKKVAVPDINTTKESLIKVALDYKDEIA